MLLSTNIYIIFSLQSFIVLSIVVENEKANTKENSDFYRIFKPKEYSFSQKNANKSCDQSFKKLPGAIIIGVKKSGTYALLRYLSLNPQIRAALKINNCELNEIHFFDHDENYQKGLDWYKSKMPNICLSNESAKRSIALEDILVVEKTPGYFRSLEAIDRIHNYNPQTKIVLIVREPVHRIQSELTHCATRQKNRHLENKCTNMNEYFEKVLKANLSTNSLGIELERNKFVRNSIYYLDLIKWINAFGMKNVFVVNGENFIKTPWIELNRLEYFLGIKQYIQKKHFHFDTAKNFFCMKEAPLTSPNNTYSMLEHDGCLGKNKGRKTHVYLSDFVKIELKKYFQKWNKLFYKLIGKNFYW